MQKKAGKNLIFSVNDLILFSIYSIVSNDDNCTFERLLSECFVLFPETFGFLGHPNWPDSRKIDKPLRILRKKKMIKGNPKTVFMLTNEGKKKAMEVAKILRQGKLL